MSGHKVGIVYSPGYGAGWSTWGREEMALDQELADAIERKAPLAELTEIATRNWPGEYIGGIRTLTVEWVTPGTMFMVNEYDGYESLTFRDDGDIWMVAVARDTLQATAPEPVAWEYYYKTKGCSAKNAHDPDCICWHKEGTGPYDNERHDSTSSPVIWRLLTSPHQQQVVEP